MKRRKNLCKAAVLCMVFVALLLSFVSEAKEVPAQIEPRMTYIYQYRANLSISDSGVATIYGAVHGKEGVTYTYAKVTLQIWVSNKWVDVKSWEESNNSTSTIISETYQLSSIGTYKVVMTCTANSESATTYSDNVTY